MALSEIIKRIDDADSAIREELKGKGIPVGERAALERARDLLQQALTPLLTYQI